MYNTKSVILSSGIAFGTSGARGLVVDFTPEVCAAFTHAFVAVLRQKVTPKQMALAIDNRPSSYAMAQACAAALQQAGVEPIYYGVIPTPALAYRAMQDNMPCIMVTGSHIPFDRNGLKFYRPDGEITKADEVAILAVEVEFSQLSVLPPLVASSLAAESYCSRYSSLFSADMLVGKRIGIYEHSSAGRELYAPLFESLGAEVVRIERSDEFVPIDTEAVGETDKVKAREWSKQYQLDAIFSTDGDGDRPLIADENGEWLRGDILGVLCAQVMNMQALAVPVSCNTMIESIPEFRKISRTRIGSPYVIAELSALAKSYHPISGFEANGGYLLGSDVVINGKQLKALPTRDSVLPAIMLLSAAQHVGIAALVNALPQRFTHSDRIQNFATYKSQIIIAKGSIDPLWLLIRLGLDDELLLQDQTDGLRLKLLSGNIIHLRPSGNAPELRCYAESDNIEIAKLLVEQVLQKIQLIDIDKF